MLRGQQVPDGEMIVAGDAVAVVEALFADPGTAIDHGLMMGKHALVPVPVIAGCFQDRFGQAITHNQRVAIDEIGLSIPACR
ncbi:MAG: hypothetical protein CL558_08310 [Alphaproteobacteria bacterium]|nr:hypothetical protein [Alphaproteobacteria bacterium]MBN53568.1 hypothetical protein [Alphaproteobacteria bacterium]OUT41555.1 MAG: hypothetical protein CBB62_04270 [Micavibrio sp. TMED2]|tara:strand:+ start:1551 stop:1796 length:246 start_codon:yes stop_codon:yes gene_type:complete